jgi:ferredoxin
MATLAFLAARGRISRDDARAATDLCLSCGACTRACLLERPLGDLLRAQRTPPAAAPLGAVEGPGEEVAITAEPQPGTCLRTPDELGFAAWKAGDTAVPGRVAAALAGRSAVTDSLAAAQVLEAAGVPTTVRASRGGEPRFVTCYEGAAGTAGQLACCGRREGYADRVPDAARAIAEENVRRMRGVRHRCADAACAAWLRRHGGDVAGPEPA